MSDGRSFLKPEELSYSERLEELERKIPIYLEKIQSYDTLFDMNEKYRKRIDFLSQQNDSLQKKIDDQKKEQQQQIDNLNTKNANLRSVIDGIASADMKFKFDIDEKIKIVQENQVAHMRYIDHAKKSIDDINTRMPSKQDIEDVKKLNNTSIDLLRNRTESLSIVLGDLQKRVENHAGERSDAENNIYKELVRLTDNIKEIRESVSCNQFFIKNIDDNIIPAIRKDVATTIEQVKKLIPVIPPIDAIRQDIQDQMHRIELDGKNAVLRASNNEKSVEIMKKQIENIYLLLKKHELSQ